MNTAKFMVTLSGGALLVGMLIGVLFGTNLHIMPQIMAVSLAGVGIVIYARRNKDAVSD